MNKKEFAKRVKGVSINKVRKLQKEFKKVNSFLIKSTTEHYETIIKGGQVYETLKTGNENLEDLKENINKGLKKFEEIRAERTMRLIEELTKNDPTLKDTLNLLNNN